MSEASLSRFKAFDRVMSDYKDDVLKQNIRIDEKCIRVLEGIEVKVKELKAIMQLAINTK